MIADQLPSDSAMTFLALVLNRPIDLMASRTASSPSSTICGASGMLEPGDE